MTDNYAKYRAIPTVWADYQARHNKKDSFSRWFKRQKAVS